MVHMQSRKEIHPFTIRILQRDFSIGNPDYTTAYPHAVLNRIGMLVLGAGPFSNRLQPSSLNEMEQSGRNSAYISHASLIEAR